MILSNQTGSRLWQVTGNSCAYYLQPIRGRHWRTSTNHRKGILSGFQEAFSKLVFSAVLRIRDVYSGSDFFPSRIRIGSIPYPHQIIKYLTQKKWIINSRKYDPCCSGSWLFTHPGSRIQGSKRHRIADPDQQPLILKKQIKITNCLG